jgi:hypothetical protein
MLRLRKTGAIPGEDRGMWAAVPILYILHYRRLKETQKKNVMK